MDDFKLKETEAAVLRLVSDTSVPPTRTIQRLESLQDLVNSHLDALREEDEDLFDMGDE